jgi:signal transduction histidine kinase
VEGRLEKLDGAIRLTIRDAGAGMAPEILARALEPFFSTRPNGAGKGLGLPIAERFVRQLGGTMTLASEPGVGTTICMNFPLRA